MENEVKTRISCSLSTVLVKKEGDWVSVPGIEIETNNKELLTCIISSLKGIASKTIDEGDFVKAQEYVTAVNELTCSYRFFLDKERENNAEED